MKVTIDTAAVAHRIRRWLFKFFNTPQTLGRCHDCGKALSFDECRYYHTACERCEGMRYAETEREHFGDPDKGTGIYTPARVDTPGVYQPIPRSDLVAPPPRDPSGVPMVVAANPSLDEGPCTVCGKSWREHGTYPVYESHNYTPARGVPEGVKR